MQFKKPPRKSKTFRIAWTTVFCLSALIPFSPAGAFVTFDTSKPFTESLIAVEDSLQIGENPPEVDTSISSSPVIPGYTRPEYPHHSSVVFLSSENWLLFAQLGALQAMRDYRLIPELVWAEGKSALLGAAWATHYPLDDLGTRLLERDPGYYFRPLEKSERPAPADFFGFHGSPQIEYRLGNAGGGERKLRVDTKPTTYTGEHLHAAWLVAQLSHEAAGGPVANLEDAPRKLALQMSDWKSGLPVTVFDGGMQELVKASILPAPWVRSRKYQPPFLSGSLVSGNSPVLSGLPFTFDRLIIIDIRSGTGSIPDFEKSDRPWLDSLEIRLKRMNSLRSWGGMSDRILEVLVNPPVDSAQRQSPEAWRKSGYVAVLEMMDVLRPWLDSGAGNPPGNPPVRALGIDQVAVDELASGGRQLLLDILQRDAKRQSPELNRIAMETLAYSGFYSDLDVWWVPDVVTGQSSLVFEGRERSKVTLQGAGNWHSGQSPQAFGRLIWAEPFYIPFLMEGAAAIGGRGNAFGGQVAANPVHPVNLQVGARKIFQEWNFPYPSRALRRLGAIEEKFSRDQGEMFFKVFPGSDFELSTTVAKTEIFYRPVPDPTDPTFTVDGEINDGKGSYFTIDFSQELRLKLGEESGWGKPEFFLRYGNRNPETLFGSPRLATTVGEGGMQLQWGSLGLHWHYYWSDLEPTGNFPPEYFLLGRAQALSFQGTALMLPLLAERFVNARIDWRPTYKGFTLLLGLGAMERIGDGMEEFHRIGEVAFDRRHYYWETALDWSTPAGPLRVGLGGLNEASPYLYLRIGVAIDVEEALHNSNL